MTGSREAKNVRQLAAEILHKVESQKAYADLLLDHNLRTACLNEVDRGLLTEMTYGRLRWRAKIEDKLMPFL